jgi:hypothetical protein
MFGIWVDGKNNDLAYLSKYGGKKMGKTVQAVLSVKAYLSAKIRV